MLLVTDASFLLLMEQNFHFFLCGIGQKKNNVKFILMSWCHPIHITICLVVAIVLSYAFYFTVESTTDGDPDVLQEWTSKRSYKDRKRSSKERKGNGSLLASGTRDPDLIFYGKSSAVIGVKRSVLYQEYPDGAALSCGYDKVSSSRVQQTSSPYI